MNDSNVSVTLQVRSLEEERDMIRVWPFDRAPEEYRRLSYHGGGEIWLALVPGHVWAEFHNRIPWAYSPSGLGFVNSVGFVHEHTLGTGDVVLIGAAAPR